MRIMHGHATLAISFQTNAGRRFSRSYKLGTRLCGYFRPLISGACAHARTHVTYGRIIPERAVVCCQVLPVSIRVHSIIPTVCPAYTWQSLVRVRVRVAAT